MVNIKDVAADAGVARSTVSYVLSGKKNLSESTKERVMASVKKLGYRPDPMARALALKRTNILGFLAAVDTRSREEDIEVFMRFVRAATYAARARGFDVLIMGRGEDELRGDILADALVVMDVQLNDPRLPVLAAVGLPTVLIGVPGETTPFGAVDLDFEQAGRIAVTHLAELGHQQIAIYGPDERAYERGLNYALRFRSGFLDECSLRGIRGACLPFNANDEIAVDYWLRRAQEQLPELTAVVGHGPGDLGPLITHLLGAGVSIPGDCSIMTIAPESVMKTAQLPLTSIDLPGAELVERAVNRVLDELHGSTSGQIELLAAELRDHGSTALHIPGESGTLFNPAPNTARSGSAV